MAGLYVFVEWPVGESDWPINNLNLHSGDLPRWWSLSHYSNYNLHVPLPLSLDTIFVFCLFSNNCNDVYTRSHVVYAL